MANTLLIAGKELPAVNDFAGALSLAGYNVAITAQAQPRQGQEGGAKKSGSLLTIPWNRASAISARSVLLQAENEFEEVDTVVLYFDGAVYAPQFTALSPEECSRSLDVMSSGYQHLAIECATRFEQKRLSGRMIFICRTHPTVADVVRGSGSASVVCPCGPFVAAAAASFKAFAENIAAFIGDRPNTDVYLVSCDDMRSEVYNKDSMLALWLNEYLTMTAGRVARDKGKRHTSVQWVKAGSKGYGIFPFLH